MENILLIQPPVTDFYLTKKRTIPYGLACIASSLIKHGYSVFILDSLSSPKSKTIPMPLEMSYLDKFYNTPDISPFSLFSSFKHFGYSFQHLGQTAKKLKPFLVGISSLFTPYHENAIKTAEAVKKFYPACKVVMGGHHPTFIPEEVLENSCVDFVLRGEGEVSMPMLAKALLNNESVNNIPGIAFKKSKNCFCINKPVIMKNLNDYPAPAFHLIDKKFYQRKNKTSIVITASRGCPKKCSFCAVGGSYISYRKKSVNTIINEIKKASELDNNIGFIDFEDENLTLDKKWFLRILDGINNLFLKNYVELRAMNGLYPLSLDEEIISAMKKTGFETLNLSIASTDSKQQKRFKRPDLRKAVDNALFYILKYNLNAVCYVICSAPFQTADDSLSDLIYLAGKKVLAGVSVYYPAPGSLDYEMLKKTDMLPTHFSLMRSSAISLSHTTSRKESVTILRLSRIINFMKLLIDKKIPIPKPVKFPKKKQYTNYEQRIDSGIMLLGWFLYDGIIRGITHDKEIFTHYHSIDLAKKFLYKLTEIKIQGSKN